MDSLPDDPAFTEHLHRLGAFVRTRRQALGLTQSQLGERLGWAQERVSVLEHGRYGMPSLHGLALLARGLNVDLAEVIGAAGYDLRRPSKRERSSRRVLPAHRR